MRISLDMEPGLPQTRQQRSHIVTAAMHQHSVIDVEQRRRRGNLDDDRSARLYDPVHLADCGLVVPNVFEHVEHDYDVGERVGQRATREVELHERNRVQPPSQRFQRSIGVVGSKKHIPGQARHHLAQQESG